MNKNHFQNKYAAILNAFLWKCLDITAQVASLKRKMKAIKKCLTITIRWRVKTILTDIKHFIWEPIFKLHAAIFSTYLCEYYAFLCTGRFLFFKGFNHFLPLLVKSTWKVWKRIREKWRQNLKGGLDYFEDLQWGIQFHFLF